MKKYLIAMGLLTLVFSVSSHGMVIGPKETKLSLLLNSSKINIIEVFVFGAGADAQIIDSYGVTRYDHVEIEKTKVAADFSNGKTNSIPLTKYAHFKRYQLKS